MGHRETGLQLGGLEEGKPRAQSHDEITIIGWFLVVFYFSNLFLF